MLEAGSQWKPADTAVAATAVAANESAAATGERPNWPVQQHSLMSAGGNPAAQPYPDLEEPAEHKRQVGHQQLPIEGL